MHLQTIVVTSFIEIRPVRLPDYHTSIANLKRRRGLGPYSYAGGTGRHARDRGVSALLFCANRLHLSSKYRSQVDLIHLTIHLLHIYSITNDY